MDVSARENYLATEVLTAPPQKLQLLLIDGAIRFIEQGRQFWQAGEREKGFEAVLRAQEIVSEMLGGLNREVNPKLVDQVAAVYVYMFRTLVDANISGDVAKLDDVLRVLRVERGTWQAVCEKLATDQSGTHSPIHAPHIAMPVDPITGESFSLDA